MWWLVTGLLILLSGFLILLVVASFMVPVWAWNKNKSPKPKSFREFLRSAWELFFIVLFPWLLMYGGVRYFLELGT